MCEDFIWISFEKTFMYILAFLIGVGVGFAELLQRYSDGPKSVYEEKASYPYLLLNGFASLIAYYFIDYFKIDLGVISANEFGKVIISATSGMAFLRSSFFNMKIDGQVVGIGFSGITNIFLNSADRAFDRATSEKRLRRVDELMKDVDFSSAAIDLPILCLTLMQNLTNGEQDALSREVKKLSDNKDLKFNQTKSIALGLTLLKYTGLDLLEQCVKKLKENITISPKKKELVEEIDKFLQGGKISDKSEEAKNG